MNSLNIKNKKTGFFKLVLLTMVFSVCSNKTILSQHLDRSSVPSWVKEQLTPYARIDSTGYPSVEPSYDDINIEVYKEFQINIDASESYTKTVTVASKYNRQSFRKIRFYYSPKDIERKLVDITVKRGSSEISIVDNVNWQEHLSKEYVAGRLWESKKSVSIAIDNLATKDFCTISYLDTLLRDDITTDQGILYSVFDSMHVYFRLVSKKPLAFKTFNGFPEIREIPHNDQFEYVADGFAVTPYKDATPPHFMKNPFVVFSKYDNLQSFGNDYSRHLIIDTMSETALDELFEKLSAAESEDAAIVRNIVNYVQDSLIYQNYGLIKSYSPAWCIQGRRADCKAKSLIAIELFKRMNIQAYPVLVRYPEYIIQFDEIPTPTAFNHAIVQFIFDGDTITFDPTRRNQTDKIGAYPISDFGKGLTIEPDNVREIEVLNKNKGEIIINDKISSSIERKITITGELLEKKRIQTVNLTSSKSLFSSGLLPLENDNMIIHKLWFSDLYHDFETSPVVADFGTPLSDSLVLSQKVFWPDSLGNSVLPSYIFGINESKFFKGNIEQKDTLYDGGWPLDYINQTTIASYYKDSIPIVKLNLDAIDKNFVINTDFGSYSCLIEETPTYVTVTQKILIDGVLPLSRMPEYESFLAKMSGHRREIRVLMRAKDQPQATSGKGRKKRSRGRKE